jgi:hypothetical protein
MFIKNVIRKEEKKDNEYYSNLKGKLISKAMNMNPSKLPCEEALES